MPTASICIATFNRLQLLTKTLTSIYAQNPPFQFEVIIVDDGPSDDSIKKLCAKYVNNKNPLIYYCVNRPAISTNPCVARNIAYRLAGSEIIIAQSDEVVHVKNCTIQKLVEELKEGTFVIGHVQAFNRKGVIYTDYTGPNKQKPFFFLGSLYRKDIYTIGGNDEEFALYPAYDDTWFGDCLIKGLKLQPYYSSEVKGYHQWHSSNTNAQREFPSKKLYERKVVEASKGLAQWTARSGPWVYSPITECKELFSEVYRNKSWNVAECPNESASGIGSTLTATEKIREKLPELFNKYGIKSILDLPCGDYNWIRLLNLEGISYIGADIVQELIVNLQVSYPSIQFQQLDILTSPLPKVDLLLCRDCFVHFSLHDIYVALHNIKKSGIKYLLMTHFLKHSENPFINTGDWAAYNFCRKPFSFSEPIDIIVEECKEEAPLYEDKSLALWNIAELPIL